MPFSPAFALLAKFNIGLTTAEKTEDDVRQSADYLGVHLPEASLDERIQIVAAELENQNGFLSHHLKSDAILDTEEYRRSLFIREIVANNRRNREIRAASDR